MKRIDIRRKIVLFLICTSIVSGIKAAPADSLKMLQRLNKMEQLLVNTNSELARVNENQLVVQEVLDSMLRIQQDFGGLITQYSRDEQRELDSLQLITANIELSTNQLRSKYKVRSGVLLIAQGLLILLVFFLVVHVILLRRDTVSYLIKQAKRAEDSSGEIEASVNQLQQLNDNVKSLLEQKKQHKIQAKKNAKMRKQKKKK